MSRGKFLKTTGGGVALIAVAASGAGLWRAIDQGVFTTGEGPAYAAWNTWAGTPGGGTLDLVHASILAANAHDSQPWLFHIGPDQINLSADLARNLGSIDPYRREMHLSLGCALENLLIAAQIATINLRRGTASTSPLYRRDPRAPYQSRPV